MIHSTFDSPHRHNNHWRCLTPTLYTTTLAMWVFFHLFAQASPIKLADALQNTTTTVIPSSVITGILFNAHDNSQTPFTMRTESNPDGLNLSVTTSKTDSTLHTDAQFQVQHSSFRVYDNALIQKVNYDYRVSSRNATQEMVFTFYSNDIHQRTKGVYYTPNTLDTFSILPVLQALAKTTENILISADLGVQHMALKAPVLIQKSTPQTLNNALSAYTVPDTLKAIIQETAPSSTILFTLKVTGWQGFIYNHRHYYLFDKAPPYRYIAHWGGPDTMNLFSWAVHL